MKNTFPDLYIRDDESSDATDHRQNPLKKVSFKTIGEAEEFIDLYKDSNIKTYGSANWVTQYISKNYKGDVQFDADKIRVFNFDIEVFSEEGFPHADKAEFPIVSVALYDNITKHYYVWALGGAWDSSCIDDLGIAVSYKSFDSEEGLLHSFITFIEQMQPDVFTGWNIKTFDIPYIVNRAEQILPENFFKKLSPWGIVSKRTVRNNFGSDDETYKIYGVAVLDYLDLYKKYTYTALESYRLDHVAYVELDEKKLDYSDAGSLHNLYKTDFQKFIHYNIKDVWLVQRLDDKMQLLQLVYTLSYMTKQNYEDTFSPIATWESIIYNYYAEQNIFTPLKSPNNQRANIVGGYVKPPLQGFMDWVLSFDLNSLYPHLIMQYNIGPDTLDEEHSISANDYFEYCADEDLKNKILTNFIRKDIDVENKIHPGNAITPNMVQFKKDRKSLFSILMSQLYADRSTTKKEMLQFEQKLVDVEAELKRRGISY